jgi:hypothetical protein
MNHRLIHYGNFLIEKIDLPIAILMPTHRRTPSIRTTDERQKNLANTNLPITAGRDP